MCTCGNEHLSVEESSHPRNKTLADIRKQVAENLHAAYERNKKRYDMRTREISYEPNDLVWKINTRLSNKANLYSSKLDDRYLRCRVAKKVGSNTYQLCDMNGKSLGVFSTKDMQPA